MLRSRRAGVLDRLLGALFFYPYRCQACGTRFRRVQTGVRVERRKVERVPIRVPITIIGTRGKLDAVATDISTRGCAVRADANASIPTTGPLAVTLHFGDAPIEIALARIAFMKGGAIGIEFRQIAPTMQTRLADHVAALLQRRQPEGS